MTELVVQGETTHTLHYAGGNIRLTSEHAALIEKQMRDATQDGKTRVVHLDLNKYADGETVQLHFTIGPNTPMLLVGPPLTD